MNNAEAIKVVEAAVVHLGHERINPESLTALHEVMMSDDWSPLDGCGYSRPEVRIANSVVMAGFRALFAPA